MFIGRAWLLAVIAVPLLSQESDHALALRSNTRLVQLDVVAEDKKGRAVTDLTRERFEVYDQGKPQQIRIFTRHSVSGPALPAADDGQHRVFTNRAEARSGPAGVTVILIDSLNTRWVNQAYARQQLIRFLLQIHPDDHVAIYSLGVGGFRVLHDFTQDASDLVAKLNSWNGEATPAKTNPDAHDVVQQLADWLNSNNAYHVQSQDIGDWDRFSSGQSLKILTAIANQLAGIAGRKNLIWISVGFPVVNWGGLQNFVFDRSPTRQEGLKMGDPQSLENQMIAAMRAISDDNVAIYPVDAASLYGPFFSMSSQEPGQVGMKALVSVHGREEVMSDIARKTGGKAFFESNDLKNAIRVAMDDSEFTYTLGYYPDAVQFNGKFRTLKVKVTDRPDVRLRYRQGYLDSPEPVHDDGERRLRLQNAVWSPLDATGIGLSAWIEHGANGGARLVIKINPSDIGLSQGSAHMAEADIVIVQKDERGKQLDVIQLTSQFQVNPAVSASAIARNGGRFTRDIVFKPGVSALRIVVGDAHSSRLGSLTIPNPNLAR